MLHVRQGKGSKDRCIPLGKMLIRGIAQYVRAENPGKYLFEGNDGGGLWQRVIAQAVKRAGIRKEVHTAYFAPSSLYKKEDQENQNNYCKH